VTFLQHAELRGKSLHHMVNRSAFGTLGQAGPFMQRPNDAALPRRAERTRRDLPHPEPTMSGEERVVARPWSPSDTNRFIR